MRLIHALIPRRTGGIPLRIGIVLAAAVVTAGCAQQETDPARALVSKSVKALGGAKRATGWTTRIETGQFKTQWPGWGNLTAACTRIVKKPDKLKIDRDFSAFDHPFFQTYFYNAGEAWMVINLNTRQYPTLAANLEKSLERVDGLPYYFAACDTFFIETEVPDDSLFAGASIDRVGMIHDGDTLYYDLDKDTHLPVRIVENGGAQQTILEDYKKVQGIAVPYHLTVYENGARTSEYMWDKIDFDNKVDDSVFDEGRPPAADEATE